MTQATGAVVNQQPSLSLAAINATSSTYMIMDSGIYAIKPYDVAGVPSGWGYLPGAGGAGMTGTVNNSGDFQDGRHFSGVSMGFADGHAKWLKSSTVVAQAKIYEADSTNGKSAWNPATAQ